DQELAAAVSVGKTHPQRVTADARADVHPQGVVAEGHALGGRGRRSPGADPVQIAWHRCLLCDFEDSHDCDASSHPIRPLTARGEEPYGAPPGPTAPPQSKMLSATRWGIWWLSTELPDSSNPPSSIPVGAWSHWPTPWKSPATATSPRPAADVRTDRG